MKDSECREVLTKLIHIIKESDSLDEIKFHLGARVTVREKYRQSPSDEIFG